MSAVRHFLDLNVIPRRQLRDIIDNARLMKKKRKKTVRRLLDGRALAMIFERPSTRTRVSFELAMRQLGGDALMLTAEEMQLGRGETLADTARVLSRYVDVIMIRMLNNKQLAEFAAAATVPVINGLTKVSHPCQVMADVLTFEEHRGAIEGHIVAWSGDANNVLTSWMHAADQVVARANPPLYRPRGGCRGCRLRRHRHLDVHGRPRWDAAAQSIASLPGERSAHGQSTARCHLHALSARASRRRGDRRSHGRSAIGCL
jgi:ornithine carbamoyltransferase